MSTIFSAPAAARSTTGHSWATGLLATLNRWWAATITSRAQQVAMAQLWSMSDRDLKDIGLTRSEISRAVTGEVSRERAFSGGPLKNS